MNQEAQRQEPVPVIVHLSGARRGTTQRLRSDTLRIGTGPEVEVHVAHEPAVASRHATLVRRDNTYEIEAEPDRPIWVNGEAVEDRQRLASGDVLEIGRDGPILRFRLYPPGSRAYKSAAEAFSDCIACARHSGQSPVGKAAVLLAGTPRELATQTSRLFRGTVILGMLGLILLVASLVRSYTRLEDRLAEEELRITGINELLASSEGEITVDDLDAVRLELDTAIERVEALEARTDAPARVVAGASRSVVFLQGSYGFNEPGTGKPLRFAGIGKDGLPLRAQDGAPIVGLGGNGPPLEAMFTGTAFVATEDGLLLTNRHVALPWAFDEAAKAITRQGLVPVMRRFRGFLPELEEPFDVRLVAASSNADLAVLACSRVTHRVAALGLADTPPDPGDEVIVLGYPTGIRALLARADERLVNELAASAQMDFWTIAQRLSGAGHIAPLASRGIVAQVTPTVVVYDAETTRGGSGGPVLDFDGSVIAVTSAIVPEFGGSNLGVVSTRVRDLLAMAVFVRSLPITWR